MQKPHKEIKNMRKAIAVTLTLMAIVLAFNVAYAAEAEFISATIERVDVANDKNGNEYVRIIIPMERTVNGITFERTYPAMAFGSLAEEAKLLKPGDTLNAIATFQTRVGESYNIHKFLTDDEAAGMKQ
jgi:hypothetical protein